MRGVSDVIIMSHWLENSDVMLLDNRYKDQRKNMDKSSDNKHLIKVCIESILYMYSILKYIIN